MRELTIVLSVILCGNLFASPPAMPVVPDPTLSETRLAYAKSLLENFLLNEDESVRSQTGVELQQLLILRPEIVENMLPQASLLLGRLATAQVDTPATARPLDAVLWMAQAAVASGARNIPEVAPRPKPPGWLTVSKIAPESIKDPARREEYLEYRDELEKHRASLMRAEEVRMRTQSLTTQLLIFSRRILRQLDAQSIEEFCKTFSSITNSDLESVKARINQSELPRKMGQDSQNSPP